MTDDILQQGLANRLQELMEEAVDLGFTLSVKTFSDGCMTGEVRRFVPSISTTVNVPRNEQEHPDLRPDAHC